MRRAVALVLAAVLGLAACGPNGPTGPSATAPPSAAAASERPAADVYAEIRDQVEAIRGLEPTAEVEPVTIDPEQLRANLEAEFDAAYTPANVAIAQDLLIGLGLIPAGSSLRELTLDMQAGQVAGYYSPEKAQLFVVSRSGRIGASERVTYAHEFTHQLQGQHFDLAALTGNPATKTDPSYAALALIEGDAVQVQTTWTIQNLKPEELGELLGSALDPAALEALARAPRYLRDTTLFTYNAGFGFVNALSNAGGEAAIDAAYGDPPASTEQVLHPERYLTRDVPTEVTIPAVLAARLGAGWSEAAQDTLGELVLQIWLEEGGVAQAVARQAVDGWEGDRLALLRGPNGDVAIGLITTWETVPEADEFAAAALAAVDRLGIQAEVREAAGSLEVIIGIGAPAGTIAETLER